MFSRDWAITILNHHPNVKITHRLFSTDEYIYGRNGKVYDEFGNCVKFSYKLTKKYLKCWIRKEQNDN